MKSMRISEAPVMQKVGPRYFIFIKCDDGNTYDLKDLAKKIGMTKNGLYSRIRFHGWQYEHILNPVSVKGKRIDGERKPKNTAEKFASQEWKAMSAKPRTYNLKKIRPLGKFEQQVWSRECR